MNPRTDVKDETSAGGVVFRIDGGRPLYLLIRDSYQNWGFPKGHLEEGEIAEAAAVREVSEETGLEDLSVRGAIETIDWFFRFRGQLIHKFCHFYLIETGTGEVKHDTGTLPVGPGSLVLIPAGEWHQLVASETGFDYIEFQAPFDFATTMDHDPLGKNWYISGTDDGTGKPKLWVQS